MRELSCAILLKTISRAHHFYIRVVLDVKRIGKCKQSKNEVRTIIVLPECNVEVLQIRITVKDLVDRVRVRALNKNRPEQVCGFG